MQDAVRDESRHESAMGDQYWRECRRDVSKETKAATPVRMQWHEIQIQPGDLKEETAPDKNAVIPAKQNELEDRDTDECIPTPGGRGAGTRAAGRRVPGIRTESERSPPDQGPGQKHHSQDCDLGR